MCSDCNGNEEEGGINGATTSGDGNGGERGINFIPLPLSTTICN